VSTILITGATGFTGRYLASRLAADGHEVHGTVHGDRAEQIHGLAQLHAVDVADPVAVERLVSAVRADKVVHLAAIAFVAHSNIAEMYRANILGTRNLLDALANCSTPPEAVLVASSANVYGNAREGLIDETIPALPGNDYGVTKAAAEIAARHYSDRLPIIVVRPFNYTGRGQSEQFLIPKIVAHFRRRADAIELGNLDIARDFSDVRAVADAYARLLDTPKAVGGTFNICSGRATPLVEILNLVQQISGHRLEIRVSRRLVRANELKALWGSPARIESLIGPLGVPPIQETLRWMLEA
jgi:nucleoside-diphosphate-sugar epimerase